MALAEQKLIHDIKVDDTERRKVLRGTQQLVELVPAAVSARKRSHAQFGDLLWEVTAEKTATGTWDVAEKLVRVDELDCRMVQVAFATLKRYMTDLLAAKGVSKRQAAFEHDLATLTRTYFANESTFTQTAARWELYFGNNADAVVPVIARYSAPDAAPTFWLFKDAF
jgi:hypothetical protein